MTTLSIIHASARFVVVDKPPGLLSVPGRPIPGGPDHQDCIASRARAMFPQARGPLIAHRLDMETSGLMVLGLDPEAHRDLSMQFEKRLVQKHYVALVAELPPASSGVISLPIRADIENRPMQIVDLEHGREALTEWSLVSTHGQAARLRLIPRTGRTHQLRLHLADPRGLGLPIIGDTLYGGARAPRMMLHAAVLGFSDPESRRPLSFDSPSPF